MRRYEYFFDLIEYVLKTQSRRHITGGILLSMSALFCGCAITLMTIKEDDEDGEERSLDI